MNKREPTQQYRLTRKWDVDVEIDGKLLKGYAARLALMPPITGPITMSPPLLVAEPLKGGAE